LTISGNSPVATGDTTYIPLLGYVEHYVFPDRLTVVNTTVQGSHFLDPGNVWRSVVQRGDDIYIVTEGYGVGIAPDQNRLLGPVAFRTADLQIRAFLKPDGVPLGYPMDELNLVAGITGTSARPESSASLSARVADNGTINFQEADSTGVQPWDTRNVSVNYVQETISLNELLRNGSRASTVFDAGTKPWTSETSAYDAYQRLQSQRVDFDGGARQLKLYDANNTHPYSELEITEDSTGKVTAAKPKIDGQSGNVDFSVVGQVLGSALGRALAPNNQFLAIGASTVAGAIGQKLAQAFSASLLTDAASVNLASAFANFDISLAGAGAGSVASFLTAELGHALGLSGFQEQLFNASIGSLASGVANKVATEMLTNHLSFSAAIGTIDFGSAAINAGYSISGLLGSYLGHELVPAETHQGAVGGQLLGAIGSAIGISAALSGALGAVLGFIAPGIGSLMGTILGTLIGDSLGSHPHPAAVDVIDQAGDRYGYVHSQVSASDGGDYSIPDPMAAAAVAIVNTYFGAVKGIVLDHSKQTMIGYVTDPSFRYIDGWAPTHKYLSFVKPDDAVHAAALDILQHSEVIGGDLILKRAHQNSQSNIPDPEPEWAGLITPSSQSGAEKLATLSADLSVAQDYENYLNNREAINALIAANPDSAFAAGWIATFARVNDLGLNHVTATDFLGGLVGWLDSVKKAGLVFDAAGVSYNQTGNTARIDIKVANGAEVPGALSVFADQLSQSSDATGTTLHFVLTNGLVPLGFQGPSSMTLVSGEWQVSGSDGNNIWFGTDSAASIFNATGSGNDILIGGAASEHINAGEGWNFVDGGAGNDYITSGSGSDILHGGPGYDYLAGGGGNDSYTFNRGDGADTVVDTYSPLVFVPTPGGFPGSGTYEPRHSNAGADTLVFGPGISVSDISVQGNGNDVIVAVNDPAHPNTPFAQLTDKITLQNWTDEKDRIEKLSFADGATLVIADSSALAALRVPFGATLSKSSVAENSANDAVVGKVTGFDLDTDVRLHYAFADNANAGGRFAINGVTGVITVANGLLLDYEAPGSHSYEIKVRTLDDASYYIDTTFTIAVTDVFEAPSGVTLSKSNVDENALNGSEVGIATGIDNDPHAVLTYALANDAGGRFAIGASSGKITVANGLLLDYEAGISHAIVVRAVNQQGHVFEQPFTIAVNDLYDPGPILGTAGADHLTGHASADVIDGLAGNDILTGGLGDDRFIFRPGSGADIVTDFAAGAGSDDRLDLAAFAGSYNLAYVLAHTTQSGVNTVIDLGGGDTITLQNVAKASLSGGDFAGMEAFSYGGIWTPAGSGSDNTWHVGDFNGDGKSDIFSYLNDSGEQVFVSTGSGFAYSGVWSGAGNGSDGKWHVGDFNGDGKDDAFRFIDGIGDQMFLSSGSSFYWNGVWTAAGAGSDGTWHVGDFNGDGKDDVFRYLGGEDVFLSNGSSFVHSGVWSPAGAGSDGKWYIGDFNGLGADDIFRYLDGVGMFPSAFG
jgi:hypothetical protein